EQRRKDAPDTSLIEHQQIELSGIQAAEHDAGDQVPGDDEEDIDADESAGSHPRESVKQHDQSHGNGPQTVDVRAVGKSLRTRPEYSRPQDLARLRHGS